MAGSCSVLNDIRCHVVANRPCGNQLFVLTLRPEIPFICQAGQFVMLDLPNERFFFRRPFSVLSVAPDGSTFEIFYKMVGQGTEMMSRLQPETALQVLGPLGLGFPMSEQPTLLIGGGIGIAPLYQWACQHPNVQASCLYGVRSQADVGLLLELEAAFGAQRLLISTDDGSVGYRGNVCQALEAHQAEPGWHLSRFEQAFLCGPTPMMKAASQLLARLNPAMAVYVSLEEHMPCGTGACTGCVVPRTDRLLPSKTCVEGPVFPAAVIDWGGP